MSIRASRRRFSGFSITELSVVVASLAVLVAVAVPASSRLGGHQRTVTCLSRIGQMTAAFLTYSQDYDGMFPFNAMMNPGDPQVDPNETWLADWLAVPDPAGAINTVGYSAEGDWPDLPHRWIRQTAARRVQGDRAGGPGGRIDQMTRATLRTDP